MPSKPIEQLPAGGAISPLDEIHIAKWNGVDFDSRRNTLQEVADFTATVGAVTFATAAEFRAGDATTKALDPKTVFDAAVPVALAISAGAVALNLDSGFNFTLTMTGDATLSAPTNAKPGQTGCIEILQDGTGGHSLNLSNAAYVFAGGTEPTLSPAPAALDLLFYQVLASGAVFLSAQKAVA